MEKDKIKPVDTDSVEESLIGDLFKEGETNEKSDSGVLTIAEIETVAGRKFSSKEDFVKHYINQSSFVGKANRSAESSVEKAETSKDSSIDGVLAEISSLKAQMAEKDFVLENPRAKGALTLVRKVAKADGVSLSDAWEQVKDTVVSAEEYKKERNIGVNSKTRISPFASEKDRELVDRARMGSPEAKDELVAKRLKQMGMM